MTDILSPLVASQPANKIGSRTVTASPSLSPPPIFSAASSPGKSKKRKLGTTTPSPGGSPFVSTLRSPPLYETKLTFDGEYTFSEHVNGQGYRSLPFKDLVLSGGEPREDTLVGQAIAMLWDTGWAVGAVHPLKLDSLTKIRRREVTLVKANFWIRYDDGFYAQRLDR